MFSLYTAVLSKRPNSDFAGIVIATFRTIDHKVAIVVQNPKSLEIRVGSPTCWAIAEDIQLVRSLFKEYYMRRSTGVGST